MLRFEDVARVASSMKLVLDKRQHTDSDGIVYRYTLYDNNQCVEDFFETLAQAWSYIYYYDEAREYENLRR
ncbi:MAG: hypothetical protein MK369_08810 [SAR202 cluster bacterium]|nr:hypothetical protein [SAR202 cluster bacterium]